MEPTKKENTLSIPIAIIAAGIIIAAAVFFSRGGNPIDSNNILNTAQTAKIQLIPISEKDHLIGNPDAPIVLVEYSDLECPACKYFDPVMNQVMDNYGKAGQVAWVFRNFPIKELHSKAPHEAEAAECVNELGGNQKYWDFVKKIYDVSPANNGLDLAQLPVLAKEVGIDTDKFNICLNSGKYTALVQSDYDGGVAAGVRGTPTSFLVLNKALSKNGISDLLNKTSSYRSQSGEPLVVVSNDGKLVSIGAAFPYDAMKIILDSVLAGMN